jgi:hypothetical protein
MVQVHELQMKYLAGLKVNIHSSATNHREHNTLNLNISLKWSMAFEN